MSLLLQPIMLIPASTPLYTLFYLVQVRRLHTQITILLYTGVWAKTACTPGLFCPVERSIVCIVYIPKRANLPVLMRHRNSHFYALAPPRQLWDICCPPCSKTRLFSCNVWVLCISTYSVILSDMNARVLRILCFESEFRSL